MEVFLVKTMTGPEVMPESVGDWASLPIGKTLKAQITVARNIKHHRKFQKLITVIFSNLPENMSARYPSRDAFMDEIKIQTGWRDKRISIGGTEYYVPKSIAFAKMDQTAFDKLYDRTIKFIVQHIIPGIDEDGLREAAASEVSTF
jgi:hypothetical protein